MKKLILLSLLSVTSLFQYDLRDKNNQYRNINSEMTYNLGATDVTLTEIDSISARTYISNFRKWTTVRGNSANLCKASKDTLKWVRLINATISHHVGIELRQLPESNKHQGIRIYPCIDERGEQNYILVYTNIIPNTKWHEDDIQKVYLLKMKGKDIDWCKLSEKSKDKKNIIYTSHHMCEPDCRYDKTRY